MLTTDKRTRGLFAVLCGAVTLLDAVAGAKPLQTPQEIVEPDTDADIVGDVDGTHPTPQKVLADTIWIATWTFDSAGGGCTDAGWEKIDNRILNDGSIYWSVGFDFAGTGGIVHQAAILGYASNPCCVLPEGYDNDWYQAIRMQYSGTTTLSFDYLLDSELYFDYLQVETDSACASFDRVNYVTNPADYAARYRRGVYWDSGYKPNGRVSNLALTNYGPGTHCVYIAFQSDGGYSPCDGLQTSALGRALVVDNIVLTEGSGTVTEDFENPGPGTFVNLWDGKPFGEWARVYSHVSDNDVCRENTSCAWLWTDSTTPTLAEDPSMAFGPDGYVVRHWLDDIVVSPWVSLASTPEATGTVLRFRRFPGNFFSGRIIANWSVRGKADTSGQACTKWAHASAWNSLGLFSWITQTFDMTSYVDPQASQIQIRHRVTDFWLVGGCACPAPYIAGPGPYLDDVRIGRVVLTGPVVSEGPDARSQAQDCFPTEIHPGVTPAGEHYRPTTDRFGTCAFSEGADLGINRTTPNLVTGDSIWIQVQDARGAGGIASVDWYGAVVSGPHAGKAPPPYTVGPSGFFVVAADSVRNSSGAVVAGSFFVDLDDTYFRGGDVLNYFWLAGDALGGFTSDPIGLSGVPGSVAAALQATGGLLEVSFLPAIDWARAYVARIGSDPHGDLQPTATELAHSRQKNCILYVNHHNARRRSGDVNRSSFMYTLDVLGYRDRYDVYDHSGMGNTNNHLGGRATIQQAQGYNLIVYDAGNSASGRPIMPEGVYLEQEKVDQAGWFRSWLAQAVQSEAGFATLWVIGSNALEEKPTLPLYTMDMGATWIRSSQSPNLKPEVEGLATFSFDNGSTTSPVDFAVGPRSRYTLDNGGCAVVPSYDGLGATGSAVRVYRYREHTSGTLTDGAIVMNSNPAENWNTILQSHPWSSIRGAWASGAEGLEPEQDLLSAILQGALPLACRQGLTPTHAQGAPDAPSIRTALYPNTPNPFNPATTILFDLAQRGRVTLRIYDVAGRRVRTLVDAHMTPGAGKSAVWDALDDRGHRVATGLYLYRLEAPGFVATRKMLLVE